VAKVSRLDKSIGSWSVKEGTPYITFTIGLKEYKGVLCQMEDEAGNNIMAFSAVSDNNNTIWGTMYQ